MKLEIQANGNTPLKDLRHFVRYRAGIALKAMGDQAGLVSVFVDDVGESDDGEGIRCLVLIRSGTLADIVVENIDANPYIAIHRAVDDAGWSLARSLARQQSGLLHRQLQLIEGRRPDSKPDAIGVAERAA
jgi:hypothetical protein